MERKNLYSHRYGADMFLSPMMYLKKRYASRMHIAMEEADLLIFMVDVTVGISPLDQEICQFAPKKSQTHRPGSQ